jgi:hypothetical protein
MAIYSVDTLGREIKRYLIFGSVCFISGYLTHCQYNKHTSAPHIRAQNDVNHMEYVPQDRPHNKPRSLNQRTYP